MFDAESDIADDVGSVGGHCDGGDGGDLLVMVTLHDWKITIILH
jgi:hypothetical protein